MKKTIIFALIAIILANQASALIINEIMANTEDDTYNEWVELYNDNDFGIDISGYMMGDNAGNDTLEGGLYNGGGTTIPAYGYAIITDDATRVYNNFDTDPSAIRLYVDDALSMKHHLDWTFREAAGLTTAHKVVGRKMFAELRAARSVDGISNQSCYRHDR